MPAPKTEHAFSDSFIVFSEEDARAPDVQVLTWSDSWYTRTDRPSPSWQPRGRMQMIRWQLLRAVKGLLGHY